MFTIKRYNQRDGTNTYLQQLVTSSGEVLMFTENPQVVYWADENGVKKLFELLQYFFDKDMVNGTAYYDYSVIDSDFNEVWMNS